MRISPLMLASLLVSTASPQDFGRAIGPGASFGFGHSVALDGLNGVVGGRMSATVVDLDGTFGSELTSPNEEPGGYFGYDVAVTGDLIAVGAPFEDVSGVQDAGRCYVYRDAVLIAELEAPVVGPQFRFGHSVALHGRTLVVSAIRSAQFGPGNGAAYVYDVAPDGTVTLQAQLGPHPAARDAFFGTSVDVSNGQVVVGAPYEGLDGFQRSGGAYVFTSSPGTGWGLSVRLFPAVGVNDAFFGIGVALDDDTLVVGAEGVSNGALRSGSAFVYRRSTAGQWSLEEELGSTAPQSGGSFGQFVAVDDRWVVVADPAMDTQASLFEREASGSWRGGRSLQSRCGFSSDNGFGVDVAVSRERVAWVASSGSAFSSSCGTGASCGGAVYEYLLQHGGWPMRAKHFDFSRPNEVSSTATSASSQVDVLVDPSSVVDDIGLTVDSYSWTARVSSPFQVTVRINEPGGAWFRIGSSWGDYCIPSPGCGKSDSTQGGNSSTFGSSDSLLPQGTEVEVGIDGGFDGDGGAHCAARLGDPNPACLQGEVLISQTTGYNAALGASSIASLELALNSSGEPADVEITSATPFGERVERYLMNLLLDPRQVQQFCASPTNATGEAGRLEVFGSLVAESELLVVRASSLPPGALCILFQGTLPTSIPAGTLNVCVAGQVQRTGGVQFAQYGVADFDVNLTGFLPGDSVYYQSVHRDPMFDIAGTNGFQVTVE